MYRWSKPVIISFGVVFFVLVLLACTSLPYWAWHALATPDAARYSGPVNYIVVFGAGAMPSGDGLLRCFNAANLACAHSGAAVVVIHGGRNEIAVESDAELMADELRMRGVEEDKIIVFSEGSNTYEQVQILQNEIGVEASIAVVTSPEHMWRCVATLRKAGFKNITPEPATDAASDELSLAKTRVSWHPGLLFRYNLWSYLEYEIKVLREYTAISYYFFRGWI
ncbi:MAG: hypothetical protein Kow0075_10750 [Salibacteraceae bacterium]